MAEELRPDEITHCYGPEPMLIEDRGMVEYLSKKPDGTPYVLRYRIGRLKPIPPAGQPERSNA